jgi:hypothetical protein
MIYLFPPYLITINYPYPVSINLGGAYTSKDVHIIIGFFDFKVDFEVYLSIIACPIENK